MPARTALDGTPCWIDLTSSDTEVAKSFYTNVFGWQTDTNDDPQYGGYAIFSKDGQPIAGLGPQQEETRTATSGPPTSPRLMRQRRRPRPKPRAE